MKGEAMNFDSDEFWKRVSPGFCKYRNLQPPSLAEAEIEFQAAQEIPLSEAEIQLIFSFALEGKRKAQRKLPPSREPDDLGQMDQELFLALARNADDVDEEVKELVKTLRQEALQDQTNDKPPKSKD